MYTKRILYNIHIGETYFCSINQYAYKKLNYVHNMHGYFSFCLVSCRCNNFLKNRLLLEDKLLPDFYHGLFWSEENVDLNIFPTQDGVWVLVCPVFNWHMIHFV